MLSQRFPLSPDEYEKETHIISPMCGTFKSQINEIENRLMLSGHENEMYIEKGDIDKIVQFLQDLTVGCRLNSIIFYSFVIFMEPQSKEFF